MLERLGGTPDAVAVSAGEAYGSRPRVRRSLLAGGMILLVVLGGLFLLEDARADHMRHFELSWEPVEGGEENVVVFNGTFAARESFYSEDVQAGDVVSSATFYFGDGDFETVGFKAESVNEAEDWFTGSIVNASGEPVHHTYPAANDDGEPYEATLPYCCRIDEQADHGASVEEFHVNNPGQGLDVDTLVDLAAAPDGAPNVNMFHVQDCELDAVCTFSIPYDHDGGEVSFRLATSAEVGYSSYVPPGPPDAPEALSIDEQTGVVTWDTTGATYEADGERWDTVYSVQVMLEADGVKAPVDFLIRVYPNAPAAPQNLAAETGPNAGEITVSWEAPSDDGGDAVEGYTVYAADSTQDPFTAIASLDATARSFTEDGLANDKTRCYEVVAENRVGEGAATSVQCATTYAAPEPPENVQAEPGPDPGEITVSWDPPLDDGGSSVGAYRLYGANAPDGSYALVTRTDASVLSYGDDGLDDAQTRCYYVTAENIAGESNASPVDCDETFHPPDPPENVEATAGPDTGEITVSWDPPPDDGGLPITEYDLYGADEPEGPFDRVTTVDATTFQATDRFLDDDETRSYRVVAVSDVGDGSPSKTVTETTFSAPGAPEALEGQGGPGAGEITLTWAPPTDDGGTSVTGYRIYACDSCFANHDLIGTVPAGTTSFTESGLDNDQLRFYWVRAVNDVGEGFPAKESARSFDVPHAPENVDARPGIGLGAVEITWEEPRFKGRTELTSYGIYRSTDPDAGAGAGADANTSAGADAGDGGFQRVATVGPEETSYTDEASVLVTYHYRVTAENIAGESEPSESACTKPFPWEPTGNEQLCLIPGPPAPG